MAQGFGAPPARGRRSHRRRFRGRGRAPLALAGRLWRRKRLLARGREADRRGEARGGRGQLRRGLRALRPDSRRPLPPRGPASPRIWPRKSCWSGRRSTRAATRWCCRPPPGISFPRPSSMGRPGQPRRRQTSVPRPKATPRGPQRRARESGGAARALLRVLAGVVAGAERHARSRRCGLARGAVPRLGFAPAASCR